MPGPTEHKTIQARILAYAQKIGWTSVLRAEAERRRRFLPHPNLLPEDAAREMMEHQLMTAQIRVHDLDLDGILAQPTRKGVYELSLKGKQAGQRAESSSQ